MSEKRDYWKVVSPEWPDGVICESLDLARDFADGERDYDRKAYIRRIRMTEEKHDEIPEI